MNHSLTGKLDIASAVRGIRHVFVSGLELEAVLGIHPHEKIKPQRIVINIDLSVDDFGADIGDELSNVVCYQNAVQNVEEIVANGHVHLVETLAEAIAERCLSDRRVQAARIRIEKPDAIARAKSVGVEIERLRPSETG